MDTLGADLRYALRTLARSPGFTAVALLTLALGIGANTAVFSVVEGVLLRSLPFPHAERLVDIKTVHEGYRTRFGGGGTSPLVAYEIWRTERRVLDGLAVYIGGQPALIGFGAAERVQVWSVSAGFFPLVGAQPMHGRAFLPEEDRPGSAPVAVLSHEFWMSRFGGDEQVIGRALTLDTVSYTIVGVMPAGFRYPPNAQVWRALGSALSGPGGARLAHDRGAWVLGRLRRGVTPARAQDALDVVTRAAWTAGTGDAGWLPVVAPLHEYLVGSVRTSLLLMLGAVGLVLLVACANIASLLLCRAVAREHEVAVCVALGATRPRLLSRVLTESVLLALAGGGLGLLLALWTLPLLVRQAGPELPGIADIGVNARVLAGTLTGSIVVGLLAGLAPALRVARHAPGNALKAASATAAGRAWRHRSSDAFIVAQVALTMVLLSCAGILTRSFMRLVRSDPGFQPGDVVTGELRLPEARYATDQARLAYVQQALQRVRALPGVTAAAAGTGMPLAGYAVGTIDLPGQADEPGRPMAWISGVTLDYFRTLGIPLKRGLLFGDAGASQGVIIDEAAARAYFPGEDPLGKEITFYGGRTRTIIGVVGDTRQRSLHESPPPHIYEPLRSGAATYLKILAQTAGDPAATVRTLRQAVQSVDASVPIDRVAPMRELLSEAVARQRFYALLVAIFAALALVLAASGVFGLAAYAVSRRTQEIGIRVALGADRSAVVELILSHGLVLAAAGLGLGVPAALAATRTLRTFLFEIGPWDPVALASVALLLFVTVLVACYLPARRAARVDPIVALRYE